MKALIISDDLQLCWAIPGLLARAGFTCDVISPSKILTNSKFIDQLYLITPPQSIAEKAIDIITQHHTDYTWVIITQDWILRTIAEAQIPDGLKLKLLPVVSPDNYHHLHSKIGVMQALHKQGICTPAFEIVTTVTEAQKAAQTIGFPVMLKVDSSGGGDGTYECKSSTDIDKLSSVFIGLPMLIQKKIIGNEVDLSAVFFETRLVHFSCSIFRKVISRFGPSALRDYMMRADVDAAIYAELSQIGAALGAHGFTNITCIEADNKRYYFEADMRPNVWVDYAAFLGDDPADYIHDWFVKKTSLPPPDQQAAAVQFVRIPYFLRLNAWEILLNRYNVWRYIRMNDRRLVCILLYGKLMNYLRPACVLFNQKLMPYVKWFEPRTYWPPAYRFACRILSKEYRQNLKRIFMKIGFLSAV